MMCVANSVVFCLTDLDNGKMFNLSLHDLVSFSQCTTSNSKLTGLQPSYLSESSPHRDGSL